MTKEVKRKFIVFQRLVVSGNGTDVRLIANKKRDGRNVCFLAEQNKSGVSKVQKL